MALSLSNPSEAEFNPRNSTKPSKWSKLQITVPETVMEECVRGYKMGDRTIRPARVKVAKGMHFLTSAPDDP